jgi:hypothetical protein
MLFIKILKCLFVWWKKKPQGNPEEGQIIIAHAFGHRGENNPGLSNKQMAKVVYNIDQKYDLSMILQGEVAQALPWRSPRQQLFIIYEHRQPGKYLDTREVFLQTWEIATKKLGFEKPKAIIIAHPWHLPRLQMTAEKIGFETIIPHIGPIAFDPDSHQWWTCNWFFWIIRELPGRIFCLIKGWI